LEELAAQLLEPLADRLFVSQRIAKVKLS